MENRQPNHTPELCPVQGLHDPQIRALLLPFIRHEYTDHPELVCLEEFAIYGGTNRADVAALNGCSHGYEIKSDLDTLDRLPSQVDAYSAVFERATLVCGPRHLDYAIAMIPDWWGVVEVQSDDACHVPLNRIREAQLNPAPSAVSIASLLWRQELLELIARLGLDSGVRSKPNEILAKRLATHVELARLSSYVREILRARGEWRSAARLKQCGDSFPPPSRRSRFRTPYSSIYR